MNEQQFRQIFSRNLIKLLEDNAMDRFDLSNETGISEASLSKYINCKSTISAYRLMIIAEGLDCSVEDLFV